MQLPYQKIQETGSTYSKRNQHRPKTKKKENQKQIEIFDNNVFMLAQKVLDNCYIAYDKRKPHPKQKKKQMKKKNEKGNKMENNSKVIKATSETSFDDTFGTIPESFYVSGRNLFYLPKRY